MGGWELEEAPKGPVEWDVHSCQVLWGPGSELGRIGCLRHGADGGNQGCGVRHPLVAEDGGSLDEVGERFLRLCRLGGGQVDGEATQPKPARV